MNSETFRMQYLGVFAPCPVVKEIVSFLRYATDSEIREWRYLGRLPNNEYRQARMILEQERTNTQN